MKKRGMKKRVLAALMTACMVVGSVPGVSLADATTDNSGISYTLDGVKTTDSAKTAITLNKEAKPAGDGKYDITLTVDATKAKDQIQVKPTEVAFVLDASGSMAWCTNETHNHKSASGGESCHYNDDLYVSRWTTAVNAIKNMSKELKAAGVNCSYIRFSDKAEDVDDASKYNTHSPQGWTYLSAGIKKGIEVLNKKDENANKILIILADGGSNDGYMEHEGEFNLWNWTYYDNEKQILKDFKATGKSYTVSFALNKTDKGTSMDENKFKALANAGNLNAKNAEDLKKVFETISKDITSGINDPLGENVKMISGTLNARDGSASYDENTNTIKWNSNGTMKDKLTLTYTVELTDEAKKKVGNIKLNGNAEFNYSYTKDGNKVDKHIKFPKPSITGATLTVNYVDENGTSVQDPVTEWVGFIGEKAFETTIPQTGAELTIGTKSYRVTGVESDDFAMTSLMVHPLKATEGKAYSVTVRLKKIETQPTIYKVTYDANGGAWDWSFSKDGYNLNATSGADKLTKENANGEETLEILSGNDLPTRADHDFDGWYLDGKKLTSGMTVAAAAGTRTEVVVEAHWTEKKPEVPSKPKDTEIVLTVIVECRNASNSGHEARQYDLNIPNSYEIGEVRSVNGKYVSTVKVFGVYYAEKYNTDVDYAHVLTTVGDITYDLTWNADTKKWEAPALTEIPT
ncbi:MAG: VWA domain-containing protein, partial [Clostridiaceae bacterium]|nr:VWA domain-containing protein [Clostridiaceae bacterium]